MSDQVLLDGCLFMSINGESIHCENTILLLSKINEIGSITQAAKQINMSYKAAWCAIDKLNNLAKEPLVERLSGGKNGGGTQLTQRGLNLIRNFKTIKVAHQQFIQKLNQQSHDLSDHLLLLRKVNMRTSVSNHFSGVIQHIKRGVIFDEIELAIVGGQQLIATITKKSCSGLNLQLGMNVEALIQASSIIVVKEHQGLFSARNQISGSILRIHNGAVNTELFIQISEFGTLHVIITNESYESLALKIGDTVLAIFKASEVIIGVMD